MSGLECFSLEQGRRPTACDVGDTRTTIMTIALRLPTLALAAALAAGVAVSWQAIGQTTLKINIAVAQNSHYGVAIDTFAREVERRTNGRYKVQTFYSDKLKQGDWTISVTGSGSNTFAATFSRKSNSHVLGTLASNGSSGVTKILMSLIAPAS